MDIKNALLFQISSKDKNKTINDIMSPAQSDLPAEANFPHFNQDLMSIFAKISENKEDALNFNGFVLFTPEITHFFKAPSLCAAT
jgi:hypothetical protein